MKHQKIIVNVKAPAISAILQFCILDLIHPGVPRESGKGKSDKGKGGKGKGGKRKSGKGHSGKGKSKEEKNVEKEKYVIKISIYCTFGKGQCSNVNLLSFQLETPQKV